MGYDGFGGMDIFYSTYIGNLKWHSPKNIGEPINSSSDDFGIEFKAASNSGFFTSNRLGGIGEDDIYTFYNLSEKKPNKIVDSDGDENELLYKAIYSNFNSDDCIKTTEEIRISNPNVYPNPNNGDFTFDFKSNLSDKVIIRIYNSLGTIWNSYKICD